jgi:photosystem II Psb28-2 protein
MTSPLAAIYFFEGVPEELSNVSLRRDRRSGVRSVLMSFEQLKSLEKFNSFTKQFNSALCLVDEEGEIQITPSSVKFIFGGMDGDDFKRMDCEFAIEQEDRWERFMRFMNRYAEANGMTYSELNK